MMMMTTPILYRQLHNANCYYHVVLKLFLSQIPLRVSSSSSSLGNKEGRILSLSLSRPTPLRDYINFVQRENRLFDEDSRDIYYYIVICALYKAEIFL